MKEDWTQTQTTKLRTLATILAWYVFVSLILIVGFIWIEKIELNSQLFINILIAECLQFILLALIVLAALKKYTPRQQSNNLLKQQLETAKQEKMLSMVTLVAGVAHEMNNPLGAILQGIQNIKRRFDPSVQGNQKAAQEIDLDLEKLDAYLKARKIDEFLQGITDLGERAAEIVQKLVKFSRKTSYEKKLCDVNQLVIECIESFDETDKLGKLKLTDIIVNQDLAENIPQAIWSPDEIKLVLFHLIKNSLQSFQKHPVENPTITIITKSNQKNIMIILEDNGHGIAGDIQKRVFDPFFTTQEVGLGNGLGLSIAYDIITIKHQGKIELESEAGQFSRFIIHLPKE